jgi:hypothetical protein
MDIITKMDICVNNRHIYKENGMKFADIDVAKYISLMRQWYLISGITPCFHKWSGSNSKYPKF